jgi:hypothetical protein
MYDPVSVYTVTADENGSSNAIISALSNSTGILVHKVILENTTNGSNVVSVAINDHQTIGSSATLIRLSTSSHGGAGADAYQRYAVETFRPPVPMQSGVSINVTGNGASATIHYTRR